MFHEILVALLGKTGEVIVQLDETFKINPLLDLFNESEREILNKILVLGYHFRQIE